MTSLELIEFRDSIVNYVNSKDYPAEVKRMILAGIVKDLEEGAIAEAKAEIEARNAKEDEE